MNMFFIKLILKIFMKKIKIHLRNKIKYNYTIRRISTQFNYTEWDFI